MSKLSSYTKLYAVGHAAVKDIFSGPVCIEEKIDGSQFSFGVIDGELKVRSRNVHLDLDNTTNAMFTAAVETAKELKDVLTPNYVYRGEYLRQPKHNCLKYGRIPHKHIVIWDIEKGNGTKDFMDWSEKAKECRRIGLEVTPLLAKDVVIESPDQFKEYLDKLSFLGDVFIEGVVVKRYDLFHKDGHIKGCKYVSERFKEKHEKDWKKQNPSQSDLATQLVETYRTEARWQKAYQHLLEAGQITHSPKDIGLLMKELHVDFDSECKEEIMEFLWKHYRPKIVRSLGRGLPDWYKSKLLAQAFDEE